MTMNEHKLYIGNLSYDVREDDLSGLFDEKGLAVKSVVIIKDRYTDRSKGFGFAEVDSEEAVQKGIETLNGVEWKGRTLTVSKARARENRNFRERKKWQKPRGRDRDRDWEY